MVMFFQSGRPGPHPSAQGHEAPEPTIQLPLTCVCKSSVGIRQETVVKPESAASSCGPGEREGKGTGREGGWEG